jgi:hypothetical protein
MCMNYTFLIYKVNLVRYFTGVHNQVPVFTWIVFYFLSKKVSIDTEFFVSVTAFKKVSVSSWFFLLFVFSTFRPFLDFVFVFLSTQPLKIHAFFFFPLRSCIRIATLSILCFISICCVAVLDFLAVWTLPRTLFLYISIIIKVFRPVNVICVYFVIPRQDKIGREAGTHEQVLLSYAGIALFKPLLFWEKVNDDS